MHHRVDMVLVTYMVLAVTAYECIASQQKQAAFASDLHSLELSSDTQNTNSTERVELENKNDNSTEFRSTWPSVLGAATAVLSTALLIAVAVKYRLFRSCLPRNGHVLLLEGDTASQFSQVGALERDVPARGMRGRVIHMNGDSSSESDDDDDDGFIEDNYIQASERERAKQEENHQDDVEDIDDELIILDIE